MHQVIRDIKTKPNRNVQRPFREGTFNTKKKKEDIDDCESEVLRGQGELIKKV